MKQISFLLLFLFSISFAEQNATVPVKIMESIVSGLASFLFFPIFKIPFIVLFLVSGGVIFTLYYRFSHFSLLSHAIQIVRGKFDDPEDEGQISHFQALTSALSATVGLGNIAGVAVAIATGGPGAIFWMWLVAFFGIGLKFTSCTLAQIYRKIDSNGEVLGGPMVYIKEAFSRKKLPFLGAFFAGLFSICTILGSLGAGNLFQSNQMYSIISKQIPFLQSYPLLVGIIFAILVACVILGGIKRIGEITCRLVPSMCILYIFSCLCIIIFHYSKIPHVFGLIFSEAFQPSAAFGGLLGVMAQGFKRASFSNEAGLGSAAIAHSTAKTKEPVREGLVAMLGPIIDTHIICTLTALTLLITGAYMGNQSGVDMTNRAFNSLHPIFSVFLTIAVFIFAYSTIISWGYYGEKAAQSLFGRKGMNIYRIIFVMVVAIGPLVSLSLIIDFSDLTLLSMAFPNIIGCALLLGVVKHYLKDYKKRMML